MSRESVCQVARSWVDVDSFHTGLLVRFIIFRASVRNILVTSSYRVTAAPTCSVGGDHEWRRLFSKTDVFVVERNSVLLTQQSETNIWRGNNFFNLWCLD
jgi:hypothetical protein